MGLLTSGQLIPGELVEQLLQHQPTDWDNHPLGPLLLVLRAPEDASPSFLEELERSVRQDVAPLSQSPTLITSEMPTLRVPQLDPPDPDQVELLAELGGATHGIVPLRLDKPRRTLCLGRSTQNQVVLNDPSISSLHAELSIEEGGVRLIDRDSKNGTLVNGAALTAHEPQWLQPMDRLSLGRVTGFMCHPRTLRAVLRQELRSLL